jgi:Fur family iron response transcriptional regulator
MAKLSVSEIEQLLKQKGLSCTLQRLHLVQFILQADHPSAEDIIQWAQNNLAKVNVATIYNTLKTLEEAGIIKKIKFAHLNSWVYDHNLQPHYHFLDEATGKISDINPDLVSVESKLPGININSIEVLIRGQTTK